jgi:hypothetical protein
MTSNSREEEAEKVCYYLIYIINLLNEYIKSEIDRYEGQKRHIVTSFY